MITDKQADAGATCATVLEHEAETLRAEASRLEEMAAEIRRHFTGSRAPAVGNGKLPAAVEMGKLCGAKGGRGRSSALAPERRSEIACEAAKARWSNGQPPAAPPPAAPEPPPSNRIPVPDTVYRLPSALTAAPAEKSAPTSALEPKPAIVAAKPSAIEAAAARAEAAAELERRNPRPPEPVEEYAPGFGPNQDWEPDCEQAVALGKNLGNPFTPLDLTTRLDADKRGQAPQARAYLWIANWKRHGWIESAGYGQYKKTEKFGEGKAH